MLAIAMNISRCCMLAATLVLCFGAPTCSRAQTAKQPAGQDPPGAAAARRPIAPPMAIGLNGVSSYGEAWQFADFMKHSREWLARNDQKNWTISEDKHGWPLALKHRDGTEAQIDAEHPIFMYLYGRRMEGDVAVTWEGDGEVAVRGAGYDLVQDEFPAKKRRVYRWDPVKSPTLEIVRSNPADHVRNIHLWMPGLEPAGETFHPEWKKILEPFPYFRFMDWGATNGSKIAEWGERTVPEDMRQTRGVAYEYMIQLCNEMGKDAWLCIPHLAADDYVRQLAKLLKTHLRPDLRVYVEYSNEIWNSSFSQTQWLYARAEQEIAAKGLVDAAGNRLKKWEYAPVLCGRRSAQIWKIMADEWGDSDRIVRTITHFRWLDRALEAALDPANGAGRVDLIGLNGYFISGEALNYAKRELGSWDAAEAFDVLEQLHLLGTAEGWRTEIGRVKAKWPNIPVTCYEGGQHFANPFSSDLQGDQLVKRMIEVNDDPRIRNIYRTALETWRLAGADGFTAFVDCGPWSKYGCWGHKRYVRQPLADVLDAQGNPVERGAHKYAALLDHLRRHAGNDPAKAPVIGTATLPEAKPGEPYRARLEASGGAPPYRWSLFGGRLPGGLGLQPDGTISGTPAGSEQLAFLVDCTDARGQSRAKQFGLFMDPVPSARWQALAVAQLTEIAGLPALPASAEAGGYAVEVTMTPPRDLSQHAWPGIAVNLTPDGDKEDYLRVAIQGRGKEVGVFSRYVAGGRGELWSPRARAIRPDPGETADDQAWDAGEPWTLAVLVRPGKGKDAIDILVGLRDEQGKERIEPGPLDVAQGRYLLRELALKPALLSGPWGLMARDVRVDSLRWAPLPKP